MFNIIMLVLFAIGIILIIIGIRLFAKKKGIEERCTEKTSGKIIDKYVKTKPGPNETSSPIEVEYIVYHYVVDNNTFSNNVSNRYELNDYTMGQELEIYYNPQNPSEHYINKAVMPISVSAVTYTIIGVGSILAFIILSIILIITGAP